MKLKQVATVLMVVLSMSMITACGKKKSSKSSNAEGYVAGISAPVQNINGQNCIPIPSGGAMQFIVGGNATVGVNSISGNGAIGGYSPSGYRYIHTNTYGDSVDLYLNAQGSQSGGFAAQVNLSAQTVQTLLQTFGPNSSVCGIGLGNSLLQANGTFGSYRAQVIWIYSPYIQTGTIQNGLGNQYLYF